MTLAPLTHPDLSNPHGFFTRKGGASQGLYAGLNAASGTGDNPAHIAANRQSIAAHFNHAALITNTQIHSTKVHIVTPDNAADPPCQADALATRHPDLILAILTADCAPVLFEDVQNGVIAAAHMGWKGALGGMMDATLAAMEKLGAKRVHIKAIIGPCIAPSAYEVGAEFRHAFLTQTAENARFFTPAVRPDHFMFNLPAYITAQAQAAKLTAIAALNICTYGDEARFFSYRRACHRQEAAFGHQCAAICQTTP